MQWTRHASSGRPGIAPPRRRKDGRTDPRVSCGAGMRCPSAAECVSSSRSDRHPHPFSTSTSSRRLNTDSGSVFVSASAWSILGVVSLLQISHAMCRCPSSFLTAFVVAVYSSRRTFVDAVEEVANPAGARTFTRLHYSSKFLQHT